MVFDPGLRLAVAQDGDGIYYLWEIAERGQPRRLGPVEGRAPFAFGSGVLVSSTHLSAEDVPVESATRRIRKLDEQPFDYTSAAWLSATANSWRGCERGLCCVVVATSCARSNSRQLPVNTCPPDESSRPSPRGRCRPRAANRRSYLCDVPSRRPPPKSRRSGARPNSLQPEAATLGGGAGVVVWRGARERRRRRRLLGRGAGGGSSADNLLSIVQPTFIRAGGAC